MSEEKVLNLISFPPDVLARISPELSLQRHLAIGIRPNLRSFEEFRNIHINEGELSRYSGGIKDTTTLGSSVLKSSDTIVICTITGGLIEEDLPAENINEDAAAVNAVFQTKEKKEKEKASLEGHAPIYPVVEVERGRIGPPTDEEQILSQRLYETFLHAGILSKESLKVNVGLRSVDENGKEEIYYKSEDDEFEISPKRTWSYVLYAKLKVFSRSGPLFDLVWASLTSALKNTYLPKAYIDENAADIRIPVKMRGNYRNIREQYQITCDPIKKDPLRLNKEAIGFASNFGIIDIDAEALETVESEDKMEVEDKSLLITDLEGEEEEFTVKKTIDVVVDSGSNLKSLTILGNVNKEQLRKALDLARLRSKHLNNN